MSLTTYIGYHGTEKTIAKQVMKTNFRPSYNGWLGRGTYFFEENEIEPDLSKKTAYDWAKYRHEKKITNVIEVIIEVPKDKVFDTTREDHQHEFHEFRKSLVQENLNREKFKVKYQNDTDFDAKVYNAIAKVRNAFLIRAKTYTQPNNERKEGIRPSRVPNATELCLRNLKCVKDKCIIL